jgi:hypothetical protein
MKPAGKTPYEIRLDLLQLAFGILAAKHAATGAQESKACDRNIGPTTSPTTEEVIAEAEKMNGFISKANTHQSY